MFAFLLSTLAFLYSFLSGVVALAIHCQTYSYPLRLPKGLVVYYSWIIVHCHHVESCSVYCALFSNAAPFRHITPCSQGRSPPLPV